MIKCQNNGCGQLFEPHEAANPASSLDSPCRFHPGEPYFANFVKGWACCVDKQQAKDFDGFLKLPVCSNSNTCKEIFCFPKNDINWIINVNLKPFICCFINICCSLRIGTHVFFVSNYKQLSIFLSKAKTASFSTLYPIFFKIAVYNFIRHRVSNICLFFVYGQFPEKLILIQRTQMLDPLWLTKINLNCSFFCAYRGFLDFLWIISLVIKGPTFESVELR